MIEPSSDRVNQPGRINVSDYLGELLLRPRGLAELTPAFVVDDLHQ